LNVVVDGFRFDFGTGGIHGSLNSKIAKQTSTYQIVDADVSSMYPNIAIANNVYPEHLSKKFCEIYKDVYEQRKSYGKKTAENAMLKLALNGVYGDSNNQYSPFFDPMYTMKITINGQLSLCLLAEKLLTIEGLKLIQVNTDGVTVALKRNTREHYDKICEDWQKQVGLQLEFAEYDKMYIRDVNNYIALYTDGKTKNKGAYEYKDLGWHKNHSSLVIPMAAEAHMLHGVDIREFITNHTEKFDFMLRTKVPRSSRLVLVMEDGTEIQQQNICRYYPCKSGGKLVKIMPPLEAGGEERRLSIDADWFVKPCNDVEDFVGDIDYDYYVAEAEKLVIKP
jgi:DNA polymerase elongation subunit (family B)